MEPKHSVEMSRHLDKQNQALMETYQAISHELHKLQVEEETIMHKLYELMSTEGLLPKSSLRGSRLFSDHLSEAIYNSTEVKSSTRPDSHHTQNAPQHTE